MQKSAPRGKSGQDKDKTDRATTNKQDPQDSPAGRRIWYNKGPLEVGSTCFNQHLQWLFAMSTPRCGYKPTNTTAGPSGWVGGSHSDVVMLQEIWWSNGIVAQSWPYEFEAEAKHPIYQIPNSGSQSRRLALRSFEQTWRLLLGHQDGFTPASGSHAPWSLPPRWCNRARPEHSSGLRCAEHSSGTASGFSNCQEEEPHLPRMHSGLQP